MNFPLTYGMPGDTDDETSAARSSASGSPVAFTEAERALIVVICSGGLSGDDPTFAASVGRVLDETANDSAETETREALRAAIDARDTKHRVLGFVGTWFDYAVPADQDAARRFADCVAEWGRA